MTRLLATLGVCMLAATAGAQVVRDIHVVNDRAPDCATLKSIVQSVTRGCTTDDEKIIALYHFQRYVYYHHAYPTEESGIGALKMMNVYGWGLCGGLHSVQAAIWEAAGYKWRYRGWSSPGHTTTEVFYGDRWHYTDTFLKFYCWMPDPRDPSKRILAGQEDILANPQLVNDGFVMDPARGVAYHKDNRFDYAGDKVNWTAPAFMVCGDDLPGVIQGIKSSKNAGSPRGWASVKFDEPDYSTAVNLAPGYALTLDWDRIDDAWYFRNARNPPRHTCGDKDHRNCPVIGPLLEPYNFKGGSRSWSNGTLTFKPDLSSDAFLAGVKEVQNVAWQPGQIKPQNAGAPAALTIEMSSPYVIAKVSGSVVGDDAKVEYSTDLKQWKPEADKSLIGKYRYFARLTFSKPVTAIQLNSIVQHNAQALPYLAPGKNMIRIESAGGEALAKNRVAVTYAYAPGVRDVTPEKIFDAGSGLGRRYRATWSEQPVVVQKIVEKFPCELEILVPTPRGKQPVYPRMLFLRREVLAPGQQPMATPAPPSTPQVVADQTLETLPNPWTMGMTPPAGATAAPQPTQSRTLAPVRLSYASKKGEVFEHQFVKWLKDNSDAWILLAAFDPAQLPPAKKLAAAKLVVYVQESHDKAPMQAAAVALEGPFEPGKPFDFARLGTTLGTTVVEKGNGPGALFAPPRKYQIDVTRAVRGWISGSANHGLALRIVPAKSVDDGWTVRFTPAKDKPVELVIETHE